MNRAQLEKIYKSNGIKDFKLRNIEDILKIHGVDFKTVDGYNRLDDLNRQLYEKFIVNIFNGWGLEARATLVPKGIYYVEDVEHLAKEKPDDDYYIVVGGTIYAIDRNGLKYVLHDWTDKENPDLEVIEDEKNNYLRFEYELEGRPEWLHVESEDSWY